MDLERLHPNDARREEGRGGCTFHSVIDNMS